nr:IS3 family transposase [Burkholderia sp. TSV86]
MVHIAASLTHSAYHPPYCDRTFFASLERELLDRQTFKSKAETRMAVFSWIEGWYNPHRRHSALGQRSPARFEEESRQENVIHHDENGSPPAGVCVVSTTPAGENPAST